MIEEIKHKIKSRSGFFKAVSVLVTGTVIAQALMILSLPVLTRLYSPEDFSVLALYGALLALISSAACLGLDVAISIPKEDEEAGNVLCLAIIFAAVVSVLSGVIIYFISQSGAWYDFGSLRDLLWMLPLGIFLAAAFSAVQFYAVREQSFISISSAKISQALTAVTSQIGLGMIGAAPFGLIFGHMLSGGAGFFFLFYKIFMRVKFSVINASSLIKALRKYKKFPQFTTFEILTNSAGIQLPLVFIAFYAAGPEAGFLVLAMKVMQAPMGFIGGAVAQVYISKAPEEERNGNLNRFTEDVLRGLLRSGAGVIVFACIISPGIFIIIFGHEWERAGVLVAWMLPWFLFQFLASPISMVMHIKNLQFYILMVTFIGLVFRLGCILFAGQYAADAMSEYYAISGGIFYLFCYFIFASCSGISFLRSLSILLKGLPLLCAWAFIGLLTSIAVDHFFAN